MKADPAFLPFTRPTVPDSAAAAVAAALASGWIASGPVTLSFEEKLSELMQGRPVRTFSSGTATLEVALRVAGIGPGDEVITTPITWVATANVILAVGARPVFVDIDPFTRNLDLDAVEAAVTPHTRALMPVYLAGLPVDMDRLYAIAARHGLRVIEDAAQAIDARWNGQRIGAFGDMVSFSFQANKNLTCAEGGCLVFKDPADAALAERYRLQGVVRSGLDGMDVAEAGGGKFNLSDIHAAIGQAQLPHLSEATRRRARLADGYFSAAGDAGLADLGVELPPRTRADGAITNWHMFQVVLPAQTVGGRAAVMQGLRDIGIGTGVHYPAIHLFTLYRRLGWRPGALPAAERVGSRILTLPLFPAMSEDDVVRVCQGLATFLKRLHP